MSIKIEKKITNRACAEMIGVGVHTVTAVRRALGIPSGVRKIFPSMIHKYLRDNPGFKPVDVR